MPKPPTLEEFKKEVGLAVVWRDRQVFIPWKIVGTDDLHNEFIYSMLKLFREIGGELPDDSPEG